MQRMQPPATQVHLRHISLGRGLGGIISSSARSVLVATGAAAGRQRREQSLLTELLGQVQDAAKDGNLALVQDRCAKISSLCTFTQVQQSRCRTQNSSSDSKAIDLERRPGGLQYTPIYILRCVLLADRLHLDWTETETCFYFALHFTSLKNYITNRST